MQCLLLLLTFCFVLVVVIVLVVVVLRWAKSRDNYRRIASESYRSDSNH